MYKIVQGYKQHFLAVLAISNHTDNLYIMKTKYAKNQLLTVSQRLVVTFYYNWLKCLTKCTCITVC